MLHRFASGFSFGHHPLPREAAARRLTGRLHLDSFAGAWLAGVIALAPAGCGGDDGSGASGGAGDSGDGSGDGSGGEGSGDGSGGDGSQGSDSNGDGVGGSGDDSVVDVELGGCQSGEWVDLGSGSGLTPTSDEAGNPALALTAQGDLVLGYSGANEVGVVKFQEGAWKSLGGTMPWGRKVSLAAAPQGDGLALVLADLAGGRDRGLIHTWDGAKWNELGKRGLQDGGRQYQLNYAPDGSLLFGWTEADGTGDGSPVADLRKDGSWGKLGEFAIEPPAIARNMNALDVDADGTPIAAIHTIVRIDDTNSTRIDLFEWDGSSWQSLGLEAKIGTIAPSDPLLARSSSGDLAFVAPAFDEDRLDVFLRDADGWQRAGAPAASNIHTMGRPLMHEDGAIFLPWASSDPDNTTYHVQCFDGSEWSQMGDTFDTWEGKDASGGRKSSLIFDSDGALVVAWEENEKIHVRRFMPD